MINNVSFRLFNSKRVSQCGNTRISCGHKTSSLKINVRTFAASVMEYPESVMSAHHIFCISKYSQSGSVSVFGKTADIDTIAEATTGNKNIIPPKNSIFFMPYKSKEIKNTPVEKYNINFSQYKRFFQKI